MSKLKPNVSFSIASSTSISIFPSRDINSQRLNTADFLHYLLDDEGSSEYKNDSKQSEDEQATIREFDYIEENIITFRPESSIFCMNCLENVEVDLIDSHSYNCVSPIDKFEKILEKVKSYLAWIREMKIDCKDCYLYPLMLLEDLSKKLIDDRNELLFVFEKINSVIKDFNQFPMILLAAQRIAVICEALLDENKEELKERVPHIHIEFIDSTLQISKRLPESFTSGISDISFDFSKGKDGGFDSHETLEKYFYSQCLKKKMKENSNKNISIFSLYQQCVDRNIPVEDWKNFINQAYDYS